MGIDEVEAVRRFGERDEFGNRPTMATIIARAEREMALLRKQEAMWRGENQPPMGTLKQES